MRSGGDEKQRKMQIKRQIKVEQVDDSLSEDA
jgi:hypothetical protein